MYTAIRAVHAVSCQVKVMEKETDRVTTGEEVAVDGADVPWEESLEMAF